MALLARLRRDTYRDSVELMRLSAEIAGRPGLQRFSAMMATPANLDLLRAGGLLVGAIEGARPNDLCLVAAAADPADAEAALEAAERWLDRARVSKGSATGLASARSLRGALTLRPDLNLALISVPGEYAAAEARRALRAGLHVMLYSDNVPLAEEVALKEEAERLGLLCMGPDCGTALIGGIPLGFANRVRRGRIGLVGASGTGLQAVSCGVHALGEGVSHALGSGGRDCSADVGGRTTLMALRALQADPRTEVIAVISKPGDAEVEERVIRAAADGGKPAVVHFLGRSDTPGALPPGMVWAGDLAETVRAAVALARGERSWTADDPDFVQREAAAITRRAGGGALAGLFTGGTLAGEAADLLASAFDAPPEARHATPGEMIHVGPHRILDLGDDAFTRGRPHPLIDPSARATAIEASVAEGATLLLLDVVLGFGSHPDPAGALAQTIVEARDAARARGAGLEVVVAVVGTDLDPQPLSEQVAKLRAVGVHCYETPTQAARVATRAAALLSAAGSERVSP